MALKNNIADKSSTELNFLGHGTVVQGTIRAENSIRIDGRIKGNLYCKNTLTVGLNGEIEGEVEAKNANISGKIKGKIAVAEKLNLESKSILIGELKANKLIIDEGAVFQGVSDMGQKDTPAVPPTIEKKPDNYASKQ